MRRAAEAELEAAEAAAARGDPVGGGRGLFQQVQRCSCHDRDTSSFSAGGSSGL